MEASLTCAVCLGVFREPVTLPLCSHNFCKGCVLECATPQSRTLYPQPRDSHYIATAVSCPLCRKVSSLPGGLAGLPVNTTLAEVVRLLAVSGGSRDELAAAASGKEPGLSSGGRGLGYCLEHPELKLELYCKSCAEPCCGKCVSSKHQGIFHNVNLLDMIYQEEKLMFFNCLKKLREMNEKLTKDISDDEQDVEKTLQKNTNMVTSAFDNMQKAMDLKKQQLLDFIKQQQSTAIKRSEVRKLTRAQYKNTVGSLLKDCENIVDEFEPNNFLQVACGLNKRMKSNLDLLGLSTDNSEDQLKSELNCADVQAALDAISALKITSNSNDFLTNINGNFSFKRITRTWKQGIVTNEKYSPFQDQELVYLQGQMQKMAIRFVSITEMPEYQHLSYEELRMKHYEKSVIEESEVFSLPGRQGPVPNDPEKFNLRIAGINGLNDTRLKRQDGFDGGCSADGKQKTFPKTLTKTELGNVHKKDNLSACMLNIPVRVAVKSAKCSLEGLSSRVSPDRVVTFSNDVNGKNGFPHFCLGRSEMNITKPDKNGRSCKKPKTTSPLPPVVKDGSVKSSSSMTDNKSLDMLSNATLSSDTTVPSLLCYPFSLQQPRAQGNEVPEDMSASSEEFYDANSNANSDVEETYEQTNASNNKEDESLTLQRMTH